MRNILLSLALTAWMGLAWAATPKQVVLQVGGLNSETQHPNGA